jgi:hypothetical protein
MTTAPPRPVDAGAHEGPGDTRPGDAGAVSVETLAVEELRATVQVTGTLSGATMPLLTGVLVAHQRAGRRYLRVDLGQARLGDRGVLEPLRARHAALSEIGGMLVLDNADESAAVLLRRGDLFVTPAPIRRP